LIFSGGIPHPFKNIDIFSKWKKLEGTNLLLYSYHLSSLSGADIIVTFAMQKKKWSLNMVLRPSTAIDHK